MVSQGGWSLSFQTSRDRLDTSNQGQGGGTKFLIATVADRASKAKGV